MKVAVRLPWKIILLIAFFHQAAFWLLLLAGQHFVVERPDAVLHERDALSLILWHLMNILEEPVFSICLWFEDTPDSWDMLEGLGNSLLWGVVFGYLFVFARSKIGRTIPWRIILAFALLHSATCFGLLLASDFDPDSPWRKYDRIMTSLFKILTQPGVLLWKYVPNRLGFLVILGNSLLWGVVFGYLFVFARSKIRLNKGYKKQSN